MTNIMSIQLNYKIKEKPEDFYVKEVLDLGFDENGKYFYYLLKKKNLNTLNVVNILKKKFKVDVGYCGNKDKKAVTEQYLSLNKRIEDFTERNFSLKFVGRGNKRLNLGDNKGNYFKIVVRGFEGKVKKFDFLENYFDEQRFSEKNYLVGKNLIKKNFKEACKLLGLKVKGNDYVNVLKKIDKKILLIYIHAYQSYLFNKYLAEVLGKYDCFKVKYSLGEFVFLNKKIKNFKIPLVSFDTKDKIYDKILKEEGVKLSDFVIKQFPELVNETVYRDAIIGIKHLRIVRLNENIEVEFELPKGSYATIVIKKLFNGF